MVNERHDGNLLVHLGPNLQACPEELLRQRRGQDGQPEYLVQWSILSVGERAAGGGGAESRAGSISLWICWHQVPLTQVSPASRAPSLQHTHTRQRGREALIRKCKKVRQTTAIRQVHRPAMVYTRLAPFISLSMPPSMVLPDSLPMPIALSVGIAPPSPLQHPRPSGSHPDRLQTPSLPAGSSLPVRVSVVVAGSWAYVLLSLSQQDGIEQHMDFDSRYTLLELFAETTSSEEQCMSFEGIHLPQV
ncbi:CUL9 protein, partial [Crotophaga sulcirostris]|nr:CUL9 protein [Crotophaga sulcirostris]